MLNNNYKQLLEKLFGKTIAIIYIFEGEDAPGYEHYETWKTDVISAWMYAVEEIHCLPLVMDIRTFIQKAMDKTLPYIDYVINLNNGTNVISTLGLVPSICSFLNIPCIPCNTTSTVCGEHKKISNIIAKSVGFNLPKTLENTDPTGIIRPIGLGSSLGVKRGFNISMRNQEYIYQEFIKGMDTTTPILYNPMTFQLEILPTIMYMPNKFNVNWFLGEREKFFHQGYKKQAVRLTKEAEKVYIAMAKEMGITTYCRIDARLHCESEDELLQMLNNPISLDRLFFLEINPMPTIKNNINFHTSMDVLNSNYSICSCYNEYKKVVFNPTHTGFILSCSLLYFLTTMH